ncbi:InlB B-repeat-containing protein [Acetobacterium bakii]|uniref:Bacterial repeat domain-containing protein n=1 Tax=Acetobacterium bakii TaxID=52689 RepID=A0A0L6U3L1_9FIRM|nr:prepilin-type N-terminal cleavage/methylation domain-containing protein [Acetobacterium bakii]KNZ43114.1 hypothetical protein AKG39_02900 [Acetobacterium bakii]
MFVKVDVDKNRDGFTMIEVIVTLVILAVLAAFAIPTYLGFVKDSQAKECAAYTAMLTRDCQQAQKDLTDSPTKIVKIDGNNPDQVALRNKIFFQAIYDEFNVDLASGEESVIKVIDKDGKKMVAGICQDGGNYYTQTDNGSINIYCDKHDGMIADVNPNVAPPVVNNVTIQYTASNGGSVSKTSETVDASNGPVSGSTATANLGYTFVNWTKNGAEVGPVATFSPTKNEGKYESATYTANFSENEVTITYTAGPNGSVNPTSETIGAITGNPAGSTATPQEGYQFLQWVDSAGIRVGTNLTFFPPESTPYITMIYTANFIELANVDTVGNVKKYFEDLYSDWYPYDWFITTESGAVYRSTTFLFGRECGTYVSIDDLEQDPWFFYTTTDNFYGWLSPADQKKFIEITSTTPVYNSDNVNETAWLTSQPTFGNLYEYGDFVYIWSSDSTTITPPINPTVTTTNNYWVKIVKK